jgi:hypothetical protein
LNLDGLRIEELPLQLAQLPCLQSLSVREVPLKVAPLFLCETKLKYYHGSPCDAYMLPNVGGFNYVQDIDMSFLRRIYQETCWRREVFDLIWTQVGQPVAEEMQGALSHCPRYNRCVKCIDQPVHNLRHYLIEFGVETPRRKHVTRRRTKAH